MNVAIFDDTGCHLVTLRLEVLRHAFSPVGNSADVGQASQYMVLRPEGPCKIRID